MKKRRFTQEEWHRRQEWFAVLRDYWAVHEWLDLGPYAFPFESCHKMTKAQSFQLFDEGGHRPPSWCGGILPVMLFLPPTTRHQYPFEWLCPELCNRRAA